MLDFSLISMLIPGGVRERAKGEAAARAAAQLLALARAEGTQALTQLESSAEGLNPEQVEQRLEQFGPNIVAQEKKKPFLLHILERFVTNPINILLTVLAVIN